MALSLRNPYAVDMDSSVRRQSLSLESWRVFRIVSEFVEGVETLSQLGPAVSVFGSARLPPLHPHYVLAEKCGKLLVEKGFAVITGGGPGYH